MIQRLLCCLCLALLASCDAFVSDAQRMQRAQEATAKSEFGRAIVELRQVTQGTPENVEAHLELARLARITGDPGLQEREARAVLDRQADHAEAAELLATALLNRGEAGELLKQIDSGTLRLPPATRALERARALLALGRLDQSRQELEALAQKGPLSSSAEAVLAQGLAMAGQSDQALARLDRVIAADPAAAEAMLLRGRILASRGLFEKAEASLNQLLALGPAAVSMPERVTALSGIAEARLARGDAEEAGKVHAQLSELAPGSIQSIFLGARIQLARGQHSEAIAGLQRLVVAVPDFVPARLLLGAAQFSQGNLLQAEQQLAESVQRAPDNTEARKLLARVRLQLDRPQDAITVLNPALAGDIVDTETAALIGAAHLRAGDRNAAVGTFEQRVKQQPGHVGAKLDLANVYLSSGRAADALSLVESVPESAGGIRRAALQLAALQATRGPAAVRPALEAVIKRSKAGDPEVAVLAASYYAGQREFERGRVLLRAAADANKDDVRPLLTLTRLELAAGDMTAAETWARRAVEIKTAELPARLALADIQQRRGNRAGARESLEAAMRAMPRSVEPRLALARLLFTDGNPAEAGKILDSVLGANPKDAELLSAVGEILVGAQRYDQALARFRQAVDVDPKNAAYWLNLGNVQLAKDASAAARESFERARTLQPDSMRATAALVLVDVRSGAADRALERVRELKTRRPKDPDVNVLEGDIHMAAKRYAEAAQAYAAADQIAPSAIAAVRQYEARRLGRLDAPDQPLRRWLALRPDDGSVRFVLAEAMRRAGRTNDARREFEAVIRANPNSVAALNNLAWLYQETGDSRALVTAERAYQLAPNVPDVGDTLGWILVQKGDVERALPILERVAGQAPNHREIQFHHAAALAAAGRDSDARARLTALLGAPGDFPGRRDAEATLQRLERKLR